MTVSCSDHYRQVTVSYSDHYRQVINLYSDHCRQVTVYCICFNFRRSWLLVIFGFNTLGRTCCAVVQEPDLNFHRCKVSQMAEDPRTVKV